MNEKMIVIFNDLKKNEKFDVEVPCDLTANELLYGLNEGLGLGVDLKDITQCYLKTINPIMLLKGNKTLTEFGLHDGSEIQFER